MEELFKPMSEWRARLSLRLEEIRASVRLFFRDHLAALGVVILTGFLLMAAFAPWLAPYPEQGKGASNMSEALKPPSWEHPCGTDRQGRDILSRVIYGSRVSLKVAFVATALAISIGVPVGAVAGFVGGPLDELLMRVTDLVLAFPSLLLAIAIVAVLGPSLEHAMLAISLSWWPWYARLVRGSAASLAQRPFVEAARSIGVPAHIIVLRHVIPNCLTPVIVQATIDAGSVILAAASLSFLGLGAQPPTPDWGLMVSEGRTYVLDHWWYSTFPGLAIFLVVLALNLVGDGLRDVFDPRTKR